MNIKLQTLMAYRKFRDPNERVQGILIFLFVYSTRKSSKLENKYYAFRIRISDRFLLFRINFELRDFTVKEFSPDANLKILNTGTLFHFIATNSTTTQMLIILRIHNSLV